jgi:hypothetical protein
VNTRGFSQEAEWIFDGLSETKDHFTATVTTRTIEQRFSALKSKWKSETILSSSSSDMLSNPAYLEIISMGKDVLPFIFKDLQKSPDHWFMALKIITGVDPVPENEKGRIQEMSCRWIKWGLDNGYVAR